MLRFFILPPTQKLRLNRIHSNNAFFHQRYNELEYWIHNGDTVKKLSGKKYLKHENYQEMSS